jgi:hypothetical protein
LTLLLLMLKRKVETCRHDLGTMAVGFLFHIGLPSQLQGSMLYGDYTDLQGRGKASQVGWGGVVR